MCSQKCQTDGMFCDRLHAHGHVDGGHLKKPSNNLIELSSLIIIA